MTSSAPSLDHTQFKSHLRHPQELFGSEGWGFESLRARHVTEGAGSPGDSTAYNSGVRGGVVRRGRSASKMVASRMSVASA